MASGPGPGRPLRIPNYESPITNRRKSATRRLQTWQPGGRSAVGGGSAHVARSAGVFRGPPCPGARRHRAGGEAPDSSAAGRTDVVAGPVASCPAVAAPFRARRSRFRMTIRGKATSLDIAYLAGVSQPTVSRALRGHPSVNPETRRRILAIARELNYKVDKNASNLRAQQSGTLALLFFEDPTPDDSLINPFFHSMLGSITRACARRGYDLLVSFQQLSTNWHADFADS